MLRNLLFLALILLAKPSHARVFDFTMESVAPYFTMQGGVSSLGKSTYEWQTPASFTGAESDYLYGGEFGVLFRGGGFGFFTGVKVTTMADIEGVQAANGSSQTIYSVNSSAVSYAPLAGFLIQFAETKTSVFTVAIGGGYQWNKIENIYAMTAQGTSDTGLSDFVEILKQEAAFMIATVGYEIHMSGSSTIGFDVGYHYTFPTDWFYGNTGTNLTGGYTQEGAVKLENGSAKEIDWSYPYFQIAFRFYIDVI